MSKLQSYALQLISAASIALTFSACASSSRAHIETYPRESGIFLTTALASPAAYQEGEEEEQETIPRFRAAEGFYISIDGLQAKVKSDDFDGETVYTGINEVLLVPKLDSGTGFGLGIGMRSESIAGEMSYQQSSHDGTFLNATGDCSLNTFNFDMKIYPWTKTRFQPHILLGVGVGWIVAEDAAGISTGGGSIDVDNATYTGFLFNIGAGASYFLTEHFAIEGEISYRWLNCTSASGAGDVAKELDEDLDGSGSQATIGVTFIF